MKLGEITTALSLWCRVADLDHKSQDTEHRYAHDTLRQKHQPEGVHCMTGKFPDNPTEKELRTVLGFRISGIAAFSLLAAWRTWEGNISGAIVMALLIIALSAVFIVPRASQLRKMRMEKHEGHEE